MPIFFPDEAIYSAVTRFHLRSRHGCARSSIDYLICSAHRAILGSFPYRVFRLAERLYPEDSTAPVRLVYFHTLLYYFSAYQDGDYLAKALAATLGDPYLYRNAMRGSLKAGIPESQFMKFCPVCLDKQERSSGGLPDEWGAET